MKKHYLAALFIFTFVSVSASGMAFAGKAYLTAFNKKYGTAATKLNTCNLCHTASIPALNAYGKAFALKHNTGVSVAKAYTLIQALDSDKDTFTNIAEIKARTFPGKKTSKPAAAAAAALSVAKVTNTVSPAQQPSQVNFAISGGAQTGFVKFEPGSIIVGKTAIADDEDESIEATVGYDLSDAPHEVSVEVFEDDRVEVSVDGSPVTSHNFNAEDEMEE